MHYDEVLAYRLFRMVSLSGIFSSNNPVAPGWQAGFDVGIGLGNPGVGGVNPVIINPLFADALANGLYPGQTSFGQVLPGAIGVNSR